MTIVIWLWSYFEVARMKTKTMAAGKFKAQCLAVIDEVHDLHEEVVITKHGKPMAKLIPFRVQSDELFGFLKGKGRITGDILAPVDAGEWDSEG